MRIVHLSTFEQQFGAARAAFRLHQGLLKQGAESVMFVRNPEPKASNALKFRRDCNALARLNRVGRRWKISRRPFPTPQEWAPVCELFSDDRTEFGDAPARQLPAADIVNLHWVCGLVDYRAFLPEAARRAPIVWTLHDMHPMTGGCHYDADCGRFTHQCGNCPQLLAAADDDPSRQSWIRKRKAFGRVPDSRLHFVAPSKWMASVAANSSLTKSFPVSVIPYGLDTGLFAPVDRLQARHQLQLPPDAKIVIFVAADTRSPRKGLSKLLQAMEGLRDVSGCLLISVGRIDQTTNFPIAHRQLGYLGDNAALSAAYSAADLFVIPSLQDNLPNTVMESLACATPVAGFAVGGIPDMVRPGETGLLARAGDSDDLARAMRRILDDSDLARRLSLRCREVATSEYTLDVQARRYLELYESMVSQTVASPKY
jgi:glycosyltransferase involved in cell wall biosynthesis